jgi:MFS family permease
MADRRNRRSILVLTQVLLMAQALALAALTLSGVVKVWHIIALGAFLGCVTAVDIPVRQSFLVEMVEERAYLGNAIAMNSLMFNVARLVGPSVAGVVVAAFGEGVCFLVNGLSFFAVIWSLSAMRLAPRAARKEHKPVAAGLREGLLYARGSVPIRMILMLLAVMSLAGMSYTVLMPVFARDVLGGGPQTLGFLMAAGGVGAVVATVYLAMRKTVLGLGRLIPVYSVVFALALAAFAVSRSVGLSMALLAFAGFGMMANMAASNTILQTIVDDDKRGRVMSFYTIAFMGTAPIGSLLAGALASRIGVTWTLLAGSAVCLASAAAFQRALPGLRESIHPIYRKMGIIPEVASALGTASQLTVPPEE